MSIVLEINHSSKTALRTTIGSDMLYKPDPYALTGNTLFRD